MTASHDPPTSSDSSSEELNWQRMSSSDFLATLASTLSLPRWGIPITKLSTPEGGGGGGGGGEEGRGGGEGRYM